MVDKAEEHGDGPPSEVDPASEAATRDPSQSEDGEEHTDGVQRRGFLSVASTTAMAGGLIAGYGTFGVMAVRFLYPKDQPLAWQFLAKAEEFKVGHAITYTTPTGATVVVARQAEGKDEDDFIALSSVCPHLGCQVHWEPQNDRFFCPCHNGVFDPQGNATEGPPAKAGQRLLRYPLKIENDLLYIEVPLESV